MRVAHVITRLIVGGAQENTISSVIGLKSRPGLEVSLIAGPSAGPEGSLEKQVTAIPGLLTVVPELVRPINPFQDLQALRHLTQLFRDRSPDIVHTHSGKAGILGRIAAARARVPIIVHTIHGPSFGLFQAGPANFLLRSAERYAGRLTTHFVVVADAMKQQYLAAGIGNPEQYTRILSGFDVQPFLESNNDLQLRTALGLGSEDVVVGMIARLFKLKGHDDLISIAPDLLRKHSSLRFLLIGDGQWRLRLEARVRALGLKDRFVFAGLVPPERVPAMVGIMDLLVHLSLREGLPRALPQAMAAGKPVVAWDCDGASEVCFDNRTGFLLRPGDLSSFRQRVLQLADDPALRRRLGERGREFVRERFAVSRMVDELHKLYLRLQRSGSAAGEDS